MVGGSWGAICADGWTKEDAAVACRAAGLAGGTPLSVAPGPAPFLIGSVACTGSEARLASCAFTPTQTCPSGKAAGVTCKSEWCAARVPPARLQHVKADACRHASQMRRDLPHAQRRSLPCPAPADPPIKDVRLVIDDDCNSYYGPVLCVLVLWVCSLHLQ